MAPLEQVEVPSATNARALCTYPLTTNYTVYCLKRTVKPTPPLLETMSLAKVLSVPKRIHHALQWPLAETTVSFLKVLSYCTAHVNRQQTGCKKDRRANPRCQPQKQHPRQRHVGAVVAYHHIEPSLTGRTITPRNCMLTQRHVSTEPLSSRVLTVGKKGCSARPR